MPSKNFTYGDVANLLLTEENDSKHDPWSHDEGSEDENKEITEPEHEDGSDDSDATGCGGNEITRETNGYEWSLNGAKRKGQPLTHNPVISPKRETARQYSAERSSSHKLRTCAKNSCIYAENVLQWATDELRAFIDL